MFVNIQALRYGDGHAWRLAYVKAKRRVFDWCIDHEVSHASMRVSASAPGFSMRNEHHPMLLGASVSLLLAILLRSPD